MEFSDYEEVMDYLYEQLPVFSKQGDTAIKKDLTNTLQLCAILGNPQEKFKSIHIAGTNGKGSSAHMLSAVFQTAGYKTGLYTSPHLVDFRERIRINGAMTSKERVVDFVRLIYPHIEKIQPSFFELSVAMAFYIFAQEGIEMGIIETGLGGRLDSTNIIRPEVSLITNIGLDHIHILGSTLPEIAGEKAGIIKAGVPVVISEKQAETSPVFETVAKQQGSPLYYASDLRLARLLTKTDQYLEVEIKVPQMDDVKIYRLDLTGEYQINNILGVLAVIEVMQQKGYLIHESQILEALAQVKDKTHLAGRWQTLRENPKVICDTGHNKSGWEQVMRNLEKMSYKTLHMVLGAMGDKDINALLEMLPKNARYYFCSPDSARAMPAPDLAAQAAQYGISGQDFPSIAEAVVQALKVALPEDMIFIGGSSFVVAEAIPLF